LLRVRPCGPCQSGARGFPPRVWEGTVRACPQPSRVADFAHFVGATRPKVTAERVGVWRSGRIFSLAHYLKKRDENDENDTSDGNVETCELSGSANAIVPWTKQSCSGGSYIFTSVFVHTQNPTDLCFWRSTLPKQGLFQAKQGSVPIWVTPVLSPSQDDGKKSILVFPTHQTFRSQFFFYFQQGVFKKDLLLEA